MIVVGLTGGIGSGKSAVSSYLKKRHIPVIDTDAIAHDLTAPGGKGEDALKRVFPARFFPQNTLDRRALARYCFVSRERTETLNSVLHPLIGEETDRQLAALANEPVVFLDVPLLFEAGWDARCDRIAVVECEKETRIARVMARDGCTLQEAQARIRRQTSDETRRAGADYLIDNNGSIEQTCAQVDRLIEQIRKEGKS